MLINEYKGSSGHRIKQRRGLKYSAKKYSNPFFRKERPGRPKKKTRQSAPKKRLKLISAGVLTILLLVSALLMYLPLFKISSIEISGQGKVPEDSVREIVDKELEKSRWLVFRNANIFLFDIESAALLISERYALDSLEIKKIIPNKLLVFFDEKDYALIWQEGDSYYYADPKGGIIAEANLLEIKKRDYPVIENRGGQELFGKNINMPQNDIDFALRLFAEFKKYPEEFNLEKLIFDDKLDSITAKILNGPEVDFNTVMPIDKQMTKLLSVKQQRLKDDFFKKQKIDLRIGDLLYIR